MSKLRVLSLGAGVQSTTLALLAAHGEIEPPDVAIFADTQGEPQAVYDHLRWLMSPNVLPFPVRIVTAGSLETLAIGAERKKTGRYLRVDIPVFVADGGDSSFINRRRCTHEFKVEPIKREVRKLAGLYGKRSPTTPVVEQLIGISLDEAHRMKPATEAWRVNRWPLIELRMKRQDCLRWIREHGYPEPPKSSCVYCPFHSDAQWLALPPEDFAAAVAVDEKLRRHAPERYQTKGALYLHRSRRPLSERPFDSSDVQLDLFGNDCLGMCGV